MWLIGFIVGYSAIMAGVWKVLTKPPKAMTVWCGERGCGEVLVQSATDPTGWEHHPRSNVRPSDEVNGGGTSHAPLPVTRRPERGGKQ